MSSISRTVRAKMRRSFSSCVSTCSRRLLAALTRGARDRTVVLMTHDPVVLEHVDRVTADSATLLDGPSAGARMAREAGLAGLSLVVSFLKGPQPHDGTTVTTERRRRRSWPS